MGPETIGYQFGLQCSVAELPADNAKRSTVKMENSDYLKKRIFVFANAIAVYAFIFQMLVVDAGQLFAEDLSVPVNAYRLGNAWHCRDGFRRVGNECKKLKPGEKIQVVVPSYGDSSRSYSVSGTGNRGYVYGSIDVDRSQSFSGYLYLKDGRRVYIYGEWVGKGEIEGYDKAGNYYELEVD